MSKKTQEIGPARHSAEPASMSLNTTCTKPRKAAAIELFATDSLPLALQLACATRNLRVPLAAASAQLAKSKPLNEFFGKLDQATNVVFSITSRPRVNKRGSEKMPITDSVVTSFLL